LKQITCQSDEEFINILNQFWTITQLQLVVDTTNNQCFFTPPNDLEFPYLFYRNEAKQKHNESTFLWSEGDVFILCAQDRHHNVSSIISITKWCKFHNMITLRGSNKEKYFGW